MDEHTSFIRASIKENSLLVGDNGRKHIVNSLSAAGTDPWTTISDLHQQLSPVYPRCKPAFEFLRCLGTSSSIINTSILEVLKLQIEPLLGKMDENSLATMLKDTIWLIPIKDLRSIPIEVMKRMKVIPENYLNILIDNRSISDFPVSVKRQGWKINKEFYIDSIEEALQDSSGARPTDITQQNARLEQQASRVCDMIMTSKELFGTFAEYCTTQTELSQISATVTPATSSLNLSTQTIPNNSQTDNTTTDATTANAIAASTTATDATASTTSVSIVRTKPISSSMKHNYAGLLQRVIMQLQENGRKIQSAEKLHDIAIILDRCKRQNRIDSINISALFECIKLMIIGLEASEEKKFRYDDDEYSLLYGKPKHPTPSSSLSSAISKNTTVRTKPKSTLMKRKAAGMLGMGVSKSIPKPLVSHPKRVKKQRINIDSDTISDSGESEEDMDDHMERSRKKRARSSGVHRYKEYEEDEIDMDDQMGQHNGRGGSSSSKTKTAQVTLESMLSEALQKLRRADVNKWYHTEVTGPFAVAYAKEIKHPMNFTRMQRRLQQHEYLTARDFDADIQLILKNSKQFNHGGLAADEAVVQKTWQRIYTDIQKRFGTEEGGATSTITTAASPIPATVRTTSTAEAGTHTTPITITVADLTPAQLKSLERMEQVPERIAKVQVELLSEVLDAALEFLQEADASHVFAKPLTDKQVPGYSSVIKHKMALSNIRTKQARRDYSSIDDFDQDVRLIVANCLLFNARDEYYTSYARRFDAAWQMFLSRAVATWPALASFALRTTANATTNASTAATTTTATATITVPSAANNYVDNNNENVSMNVSNTANSALLKDLTTSNIPGVTINIPPADGGQYVLDGEFIALEKILTAADIRSYLPEDVQASHAAHSPSAVTLRAILTAVWDYLADLDEEGFFATPVTFPDYLLQIAHPMDLSTIRVKIDRKKYRSIADFDRDVMLMMHNCFTYNTDDSLIYSYAEQMQFAWHLIRQNIQSVLTGDDSLAVQLEPPHLDTGDEEEEEMDGAQGKDEVLAGNEDVKKEVLAENKEVAENEEVKEEVVAKNEEVLQGKNEEVAEQQQTIKSQVKPMEQETQELVPNEKHAEEEADDASIATQPLLDIGTDGLSNQNTASELDLLLGSPDEIKSEPMDVVPSPTIKIATQQRNATPSPVAVKLTLKSNKAVESARIEESVIIVPNTANDTTLVSSEQNATERAVSSVDKKARPVPSPVLRSLRTAVQQLRSPPVLVNNRIYTAERAATLIQQDSTVQSLALPDLPPVFQTDSQLRWTLVLLRDFSVQALLRKQFAMRLRDLIYASCDTTSITVDSPIVTSNAQPGQFSMKCMLPAADSVCRCLFQLCQLSLTYANRLDALDEYVLRVYIPLVIYHVLLQAENNNPANTNPTTDSATPAIAVVTGGKSLVLQAKEVLQSVFEQEPIDRAQIVKSSSSCFANAEVLRDFLESIAKHLINMKIQIHSTT